MIQVQEAIHRLWLNNVPDKEVNIIEKYRKIKPLNKTKIIVNTTLLTLLVLTVYSFITFDYKDVQFFSALKSTYENLALMFSQAHFKHFSLKDGLYQILFTLGIAFLATLTGGIFAFFLGLFSAQNLSSRKVSSVIKGFVSFVRAVPTVLWVLIFAVSIGLGSTAAVVGLTFHTFGYLLKAFSESFEELDPGVIEALKACGANWWQIVFQAVIPSSLSYLLAWTFMRFEINFVEAVAVGAAAGAGGIGFELYMASGHYFDLREVGMITWLILGVALILESSSSVLKSRFLKH
jgi:phosphonate transport system permease protein